MRRLRIIRHAPSPSWSATRRAPPATRSRARSATGSAAWGQPVIIDNRPGVGGNIGAAHVARSPADGYTLMVGTDATMTSNVHLYRSTPFDPVRDFAPITNAAANIIGLAVNAEV